ncbi:MAG: Gldg family protein [Alteraurantiacibacter sp.]
MRRFSKFICALSLACAAFPAGAQEAEPDTDTRPHVGVMTTIPIFWGEPAEEAGDDFWGGLRSQHWALDALGARYAVAPLDYLAAEELRHYDALFLAQPRGLTGEENVALDSYVRSGGRVLVLADPMMTGESVFHIGDRRRPQDSVLLSPILARWGVELHFDAGQAYGVTLREIAGQLVPLNMPGQFVVLDTQVAGDSCSLEADGLLARCRIGSGEVLLLADAAVLDLEGPHEGARQALVMLTAHIFPDIGDGAGREREIPIEIGESPGNAPVATTGDADRAADQVRSGDE